MKMKLTHKQDLAQGHQILPIDDDDAVNVPVPNDDKSDTLEYYSSPEGLTDSDDTVEYQDLVIIDDESWSLLTEEQKLCSNTGSFSVPRYIDNSTSRCHWSPLVEFV